MALIIHPIDGIPRLEPGDDLHNALFTAIERNRLRPDEGDVLVVCQKVVSKAEGRIVDLNAVSPSPFARRISALSEQKDPRLVEVVLRETKRIVKMDRGHLIVETGPGWVCANAGIDNSNSGGSERVVLLPVDPDASARRLADAVREKYGRQIAVIITDTFGRPWREGLVDFALGVAGIAPLADLRGTTDMEGRELRHTILAQADALAAAAGLVMKKADGIPAALIRGFVYPPAEGSATELIRSPEKDLFR
jgi:coenzyme F420-0:L-glutamate ligase/coenzyme F420-1:gamma-L-glutamate ligase